jgi:hypothetical protein
MSRKKSETLYFVAAESISRVSISYEPVEKPHLEIKTPL